MKIVTILGARPQFIKAAALSRLIRTDQEIQEIIVHTVHHYDANMSDVFFEQMDIPRPQYHLGVQGKTHGHMTGIMLENIEQVLMKENPEWVIVYGDTNSTLAGSLAAKKLHLKVAHVEAGLRSFNMRMPEEINRIVTDRISDVLFCPSQMAVENLNREGFRSFPCAIHDVGDIMKDVAFFYRDSNVSPPFQVPEKFILATIHRAENTDNPQRLLNILKALDTLAQSVPVILPVHPRTKNQIEKMPFKGGNRFLMCAPVGYLEMVYLLKHCTLVVTDSGGLQKEAFYFNKYCVTTRDETEWTELIDAGYNTITGADPERILAAVDQFSGALPPSGTDLYGDGKTSEEILKILKEMAG